jgi:hypothetical protein
MVYQTQSWTAWLLWVRHGLMKGKPFTSPKQCVYVHLESPGTKVYTKTEGGKLLDDAGFTDTQTDIKLGPGDLLLIKPSGDYEGRFYKAIWAIYPRWLVRLIGHRFGLYLMMKGRKPVADPSTDE